MKKDYTTRSFDVAYMDKYNEIEHDGSLIRDSYHWLRLLRSLTKYLRTLGEDAHFQPDQSRIAVPLIEDLLNNASETDKSGNPILTPRSRRKL